MLVLLSSVDWSARIQMPVSPRAIGDPGMHTGDPTMKTPLMRNSPRRYLDEKYSENHSSGSNMSSERFTEKSSTGNTIMAMYTSQDEGLPRLILKTAVIGWLAYYVLSCIHSRYFHPLSAFPGPFWASISNFYKLWIFSTKQSHTLGIEYHKKYGAYHIF